MESQNLTPSFSQLVAQPTDVDGLALLEALINDAVLAGASDIHVDALSKAYRVRLRIDGSLADASMVERIAGEQLIRAFEVGAQIDSATSRLALDGRMATEVNGVAQEIRVASAPGMMGKKITARILSSNAFGFDLSNIGLADASETVREALNAGNGLILVSGPTGSGKTTTCYALLAELLARGTNLVTLEDPVEYQLEGATQIEVDADAGFTFQEGIRTLLRHDPDALFLGEIRDSETAVNAVDASFSGHTVLSTVHARHCVSTVTMLRSMGVADHMLAAALRLIINQRLVRTLCEDCKEERGPKKREKKWLKVAQLPVPESVCVPKGCKSCGQSGYAGRQPLFSVWKIDDAAYDLILSGADDRALARMRSESRESPLLQGGVQMLQDGQIDVAGLRTLA